MTTDKPMNAEERARRIADAEITGSLNSYIAVLAKAQEEIRAAEDAALERAAQMVKETFGFSGGVVKQIRALKHSNTGT